MKSWMSWKPLWAVALLAMVCIVGTAVADNDNEESQPPSGKGGKGKGGKGARSYVVQVDLAKMPKELAKQVWDYVIEDDAKAEPKGEKGKMDGWKGGKFGGGKGGKGEGWKGFEKGNKGKGEKGEKGKGEKGKGFEKGNKGPDGGPTGGAGDLDRRLQKLLVEIEELRKEIRRKE